MRINVRNEKEQLNERSRNKITRNMRKRVRNKKTIEYKKYKIVKNNNNLNIKFILSLIT